jgi:hypothetical protein
VVLAADRLCGARDRLCGALVADRVLARVTQYSAWGFNYRDFNAFISREDPSGMQTLSAYIAQVRTRNPTIPPPVATNIELTGTALEGVITSHALVPLPDGRTLAYLNLLDPTHLIAFNPSIGQRVSSYRQGLQREMWRLHMLPTGFPEVVVLSLDELPMTLVPRLEPYGGNDAFASNQQANRALDDLMYDIIGIDVVLVSSAKFADTWRMHVNVNDDRVLVVGRPLRTHGASVDRINATFDNSSSTLAANGTAVVAQARAPTSPGTCASTLTLIVPCCMRGRAAARLQRERGRKRA